MFGWWRRTKECSPLDGEELLYTDRTGRFAVTTHRLRVRKVFVQIEPRNQAPAGDFMLEDISRIGTERRKPRFPWTVLSVPLTFVFLLVVLPFHPIWLWRVFIFFATCHFVFDLFTIGSRLFAHSPSIRMRLNAVYVGREIYWEVSPLSVDEAYFFEETLKSARNARLRLLAANEEEAAR